MRRAALGLLLALTAACGLPGGEPPGPATYAALGDSYSSGEGAGSYDAEPEDCRRSSLAWPRLLDAQVDLRACSGTDVSELSEQIPGEADAGITLVTLTVGGNDAGFGDIFEACLRGPCPSATNPAFLATLGDLSEALVAAYDELAAGYPEARIVHVGYPQLTPPPGDPVGACFWLPPEDQANATAIVEAINGAIEYAVGQSSSGVEYLSVADAFEDHELCTPLPYVSLLARAHPNAAGQHALRAAVAAGL